VSLPGTAFAFAAAHPVVASVVVDAGTPRQVARVADLATRPSPPADLWSDLVAARLLRPEAPVPA
jgi:D-threo-aldose 1-dehydrogenase